MVDKIKGGLADNMTLDSIAKKHGVELSSITLQLEKGIAVEMEHTDSKEKAEEIAKDHLFEDAEYYTKLKTIEKQNSKDWAKTYKASNFIEKGVCTYNDETIYLSQECLNKAIMSIKGRPVVIQHQKVTPQNMEDHAVGYVSACGFSEYDASFYCDFIVFDDEGKEVIAKDYSVSCAYIPKAFGKGGTWHNTPYDREVTELEFTHLALVPDPRYEDAKIYENAKSEDNMYNNIFDESKHPRDKSGKFAKTSAYSKLIELDDSAEDIITTKDDWIDFTVEKAHILGDEPIKGSSKRLSKVIDSLSDIQIQKLKNLYTKYGILTEKQNSTDNTTKETYNMDKIEVEQGFLASLIELAQKPFLNSKKEEKEEEKEEMDDDEMEYEGKKYSKKELVNAYESACAGKKAKEEKEKMNEKEAEEEEKENSKDSDEDMEFFNSMQKLMAESQTDANDKVEVYSQNKGLELGSKAFG